MLKVHLLGAEVKERKKDQAIERLDKHDVILEIHICYILILQYLQ